MAARLTSTIIFESHTNAVAAKLTEKAWKLVQHEETTITIDKVNGAQSSHSSVVKVNGLVRFVQVYLTAQHRLPNDVVEKARNYERPRETSTNLALWNRQGRVCSEYVTVVQGHFASS